MHPDTSVRLGKLACAWLFDDSETVDDEIRRVVTAAVVAQESIRPVASLRQGVVFLHPLQPRVVRIWGGQALLLRAVPLQARSGRHKDGSAFRLRWLRTCRFKNVT